jgi:ubiquinone biosynthesis protein UbiJ
MHPLFLSGLESGLNAYLKLDPDTSQKLTPLAGKIISLEITDWNVLFLVRVDPPKLCVLPPEAATPDTCIRGKLFNLLKTGCQAANHRSLLANSIEISGDTELGKQLQDIFSKIEIDWEEHLSSITGDIIAHRVGSALRFATDLGQKTISELALNFKEYLQQEQQLLISAEGLEDFIQQVTVLQNDTERLAARIDHLYQRHHDHDAN